MWLLLTSIQDQILATQQSIKYIQFKLLLKENEKYRIKFETLSTFCH